jgi:DNA-binding MarR family transcriptional regulator
MPSRTPLIQLVETARRWLQTDMVASARNRGWTGLTYAHNSVFSTLSGEGSRASDMAAMAGITRQSMGEIIRGMVALGLVEMRPDPDDGRAKIVAYTARGRECSHQGFQHIIDRERRFEEEFGADYETARHVLGRVVEMLAAETDLGVEG